MAGLVVNRGRISVTAPKTLPPAAPQQRRRRSFDNTEDLLLLEVARSADEQLDFSNPLILPTRDATASKGSNSRRPSKAASRNASPDEDEHRRSRRPSPGFEDKLPEGVQMAGGLGVVGSKGSSIVEVKGRRPSVRRNSRTAGNGTTNSSRGPDARRRNNSSALRAGANIASSAPDSERPPLGFRRPSLPGPERPPLGSTGAGSAGALAGSTGAPLPPETPQRSGGPNDGSKEVGLRSLAPTMEKLSFDRERSLKNLDLLANTARAVQVFKDALSDSHDGSQERRYCSELNDALVTYDEMCSGLEQDHLTTDQLTSTWKNCRRQDGNRPPGLGDVGDGSNSLSITPSTKKTPTSMRSLASVAGDLRNAASLDSPGNAGKMPTETGDSTDAAENCPVSPSGAGARSTPRSQKIQNHAIGDVVEHFFVSDEDPMGKWIRCKVVNYDGPPYKYDLQVVDPNFSKHGLVGDSIFVEGAEENLLRKAHKFVIGDVVEAWVITDDSPTGRHVRCRVAGTPPFLKYNLTVLERKFSVNQNTDPNLIGIEEKHVREGTQVAEPAAPSGAAAAKRLAQDKPKEGATSRPVSKQGADTVKQSDIPSVPVRDDIDESSCEDDDDLLDQFMEDLFAEYAVTKDNKGRPLMNNMGVRRFFSDFTIEGLSGSLNKIIAIADVSYADEIERQRDMSFRFDLSKAEAKRGLCFKSFCILMDEVYPRGTSRTVLRSHFKTYAGDAHAMKEALADD